MTVRVIDTEDSGECVGLAIIVETIDANPALELSSSGLRVFDVAAYRKARRENDAA